MEGISSFAYLGAAADPSEANQQRTVLKYFYQGVLLLISCYFSNTLFIVLMFTVWGKPARNKQICTSFNLSSSAYLLPSPSELSILSLYINKIFGGGEKAHLEGDLSLQINSRCELIVLSIW